MKRILIIDDDPDLVSVLQLMLKMKGFIVAAAPNESQVWQQVGAFNPDLILMDVLLSGADGRTICRQLKDSEFKQIPIIMFSAHPGAQKNMTSYGADDFLAKPFQEKDLLQKIETHLARKPQTQ